MTEKLPRVTAVDTIKALERAGFYFSRQSGSHKIYKNKEGKRTTVPYHFKGMGEIFAGLGNVPPASLLAGCQEQGCSCYIDAAHRYYRDFSKS